MIFRKFGSRIEANDSYIRYVSKYLTNLMKQGFIFHEPVIFNENYAIIISESGIFRIDFKAELIDFLAMAIPILSRHHFFEDILCFTTPGSIMFLPLSEENIKIFDICDGITSLYIPVYEDGYFGVIVIGSDIPKHLTVTIIYPLVKREWFYDLNDTRWKTDEEFRLPQTQAFETFDCEFDFHPSAFNLFINSGERIQKYRIATFRDLADDSLLVYDIDDGTDIPVKSDPEFNIHVNLKKRYISRVPAKSITTYTKTFQFWADNYRWINAEGG